MGQNIKLAPRRQNLTTMQVAERAGIDRSTFYQIEKGIGRVSLAAYPNTFRVLRLRDDFLKPGADNPLGGKLEDLELLQKQ